MRPTNSVKNIEWWEVSDDAKQTWYFRVMTDGKWVMVPNKHGILKWWVMSDGNWVKKKQKPNKALGFLKTLPLYEEKIHIAVKRET